MHKNDPSRSGNQDRAQGGRPTSPQQPGEKGETEAYGKCQRKVILVLPDGQAILLEIPYPGQRRLGPHPEEEPADMRMEKPLRNVMRIILVVGKFVMPPMVGRPEERRPLEGRSPTYQGKKLHRPFGSEGKV